MLCCKCHGAKTMPLTVVTVGKAGQTTEKMTIKCVACDGKGTMTTEQIAREKRMDEAWCKCGNPSGRSRAVTDPNALECLDCGGALSIG